MRDNSKEAIKARLRERKRIRKALRVPNPTHRKRPRAQLDDRGYPRKLGIPATARVTYADMLKPKRRLNKLNG